MPSKNYTTIALPKDLMALVDEFLKENPWGFRSRPEVITTSVREFLQRHADKRPNRR